MGPHLYRTGMGYRSARPLRSLPGMRLEAGPAVGLTVPRRPVTDGPGMRLLLGNAGIMDR